MSYRYLTPPMLEHLARYKYVSAGYTWLDCQLTPFWNWLVELLPMWMAPNMVTFIGFVGITAMTGVVCFAAPVAPGLHPDLGGVPLVPVQVFGLDDVAHDLAQYGAPLALG